MIAGSCGRRCSRKEQEIVPGRLAHSQSEAEGPVGASPSTPWHGRDSWHKECHRYLYGGDKMISTSPQGSLHSFVALKRSRDAYSALFSTCSGCMRVLVYSRSMPASFVIVEIRQRWWVARCEPVSRDEFTRSPYIGQRHSPLFVRSAIRFRSDFGMWSTRPQTKAFG